MISHGILRALEREVVGQRRAVDTVVRALTIGAGRLNHPDAPLGIYLFLGPSGTGKTHMARSLAQILHGDRRRLGVVDCIPLGNATDPWQVLARQVARHFQSPSGAGPHNLLSMPPHSILIIEHLDAMSPDLVKTLVRSLETGLVPLPDEQYGSLRDCLILMTSTLCAREIYGSDRREVGFSPAAEPDQKEKARIFHLCSAAVERTWGEDLLGHLDDLVVFHRLREIHLPFILGRMVGELNRRLAPREIAVTVGPEAEAFLLSRGGRFLQHGAWFLVKVFRRFVVFPLADLLASGRTVRGARVRVELEGERLRFEVEQGNEAAHRTDPGAPFAVTIDWDTRGASAT